MQTRARAILVSLVLAIVVAACGSPAGAASAGSRSPVAAGALTVAGAWVRATPAGGTSAAYLAITNTGATEDALVAVEASSVTASATIHETSTGDSGMTGMHHTPALAIAAGNTVRLEPGGLHIMLADLTKELSVGERVSLTLTFDHAGAIDVSAEVRAN